jgi:hypothetical protein
MVDVSPAIAAESQMTYTHAANLPAALGQMISQAVADYAQTHRMSSESWRHGLPIWVLRETDTRVNRVQIEAILHDGRSLVSIAPDAYQDSDQSVKGSKKVRRRFSNPNDTRSQAQRYEFGLLVTRERGGPWMAQDDAFSLLITGIERAFAEARVMPLDEGETLSYQTPFA